MTAGFLQPLIDAPGAGHVLCDGRTGTVVATRLEPAFDSDARRRGLTGRDCLEPGTALVIAPCEAVHTFFMRFAIDIAFVARNGRIVGLRHAVRPWRIAVSPTAFATIELPAGTLRATATLAGDVFKVLPDTELSRLIA